MGCIFQCSLGQNCSFFIVGTTNRKRKSFPDLVGSVSVEWVVDISRYSKLLFQALLYMKKGGE